MKILQLGKFYPIRGGVEKVMRDLTEGISSRGIHCDMLCATMEEPGVINLNDFGRIICVKACTKKAATMIAPAMVSYLRKHKKEYDIIHVHHPDPMAALALMLSGYKGRVVLHWHSDIVSQKLLFVFYRPLQNWLLRRCDTIIGTSPVYLESSPYLASYQDKCTAVPIGITPLNPDPDKIQKLKSRYPDKTIALCVGRLVPYKGMEYLIDAAALLPERFHIVIGGSGPLYVHFCEKIDEMGLGDRVSLLGYVSDSDIAAWFGACDLFVLPSVMKTEAFGIVQIEAMSIGKPVVATKIPGSGVSWVNKEGVSGKNAVPGDAKALADAILSVTEHQEQFGKGAQELFKERYQISAMIDKTLQIYENINK